MTTTRPTNGSTIPDKTINPIFPPMNPSPTNGIRAPLFPPNSANTSSNNAPIFPPSIQRQPSRPPSQPQVLQQTMQPNESSSNTLNTKVNSALFTSNVNNSAINPTQQVLNPSGTSFAPLSNTYNTNGNSTPPPTNIGAKLNPITTPTNPSISSTLPTVQSTNISSTTINQTPPLPNSFHPNSSSLQTNTFNPNGNFVPPPLSSIHTNRYPTPQYATAFSPNSSSTSFPSNTFNSNPYHSNMNTVPPPQGGFSPNMNSAVPATLATPTPLPPPTATSATATNFNSNPISAPPIISNTYTPVQGYPSTSVRPMYPSPASAYQTQSQQKPLQPPSNSNIPPPPPSVPGSSTSTATYPYPQNSFNTNSSAVAQPPPTGPYPMGGSATNASHQQNYPPPNNEVVDLLKEKNVVSPYAEEPPVSPLLSEENQQMNCTPEVMRCSLNVIPQTKDLLNKSRLPLGILIHPFKDLESLSVIQGTKIVRCDSCKSYINPFITFIDNTRWRCSICFRVNDLPQEFLYDPITKTYGDPSRRPEVRYGTVEYTATADYMARPPQPAMYLFLLDVSHNAVQTGYLQSFCDILLECLNGLPGDARTQIGFLTYDSRIQFYDLSDRLNGTFRIMVAPDLDSKPEDFLPLPDSLMVTLCECRSVVETFLNELPKIYQDNNETDSALGAALQIAGKLLNPTGGRITIFQTRIPNINPGALNELNTSTGHSAKEPTIVGPTSDFYKKLSLDFASVQIACDLFLLNSHHIDMATLSCISKYSAGEVKYYPGFHSVQTPHEVERFENDLRRYLQRKIGFEAVMRLRSPPALSIHTFHGSGFVRSVDLLVLPNINPDAAFGIQISIEDSLVQYTTVTFQAALLYTSSKGERRIRVHTLSLPVSSNLTEICSNADQEAIVSLISKMAADRAMTSSIQEARDAMTNVACDVLKAYSANNVSNRGFSLLAPFSLRLLPLYMLSMIKSTAFRAGIASKLDDRAYYLELCKTSPIQYLIQVFYPDLYPIHTIEDKSQIVQDGEDELYIPQRVHLSFQHIDSHGAYILDTSEYIYIYIGKAVSDHFVQNVFNVQTFSALPYDSYSLPELENSLSMKIHNFLSYLIQSRPHGVAIHVMREDSANRHLFTRHLVDDKSESTMSYVEYLRYIREQITR